MALFNKFLSISMLFLLTSINLAHIVTVTDAVIVQNTSEKRPNTNQNANFVIIENNHDPKPVINEISEIIDHSDDDTIQDKESPILYNPNLYNPLMDTPIVLMHGVNTDSSSLDYIVNLLKETFPTKFILNVEVGDGKETSLYTPMFEQVDMFNKVVQSHPELENGFHLIGFSQGTLITRAYIELYNNPPVINYISLAGPQAGQFGVPFINIPVLDFILSGLDYLSPFQEMLAPGQYWKNPSLIDLYTTRSMFLAVINNERNFNQTFYDNFVSINKLVLVYSTNDKVIHPPISGWFGFYDKDMNIQNFNQTNLYLKDLFGLKKMEKDNKIVFYQTEFEHHEHSDEIATDFIKNNLIQWLY